MVTISMTLTWYCVLMENRWLTVTEVAQALDISADTVRRWNKKGLIKAQRNQYNHRVFNLDEVSRLKNKDRPGQGFRVLTAEPTDIHVVELFAGAGGMALGLENAGLKSSLLVEIDKHAVTTLRTNRPDWNVIHGDVADVDYTDLSTSIGSCDVVVGGFPCQAFSYAGNKQGFADTRGTLFFEFARSIESLRPKIAIGENVRGLLRHDHGRTLKTMVKVLQDLGYNVAYHVLRAQYLDVAQKRERLIIVAVRADCDIPALFPKEKDYVVTLGEALDGVPASPGQTYSAWKHDVLALVPPGGYWRDLPDDVQRTYMKKSYHLSGGKTGMARRLSFDEPSLTLTCSPAQKQTERCHPSETRPLTVREYARIQSFPDSWAFSGSLSAQYKQIGNAVPVNLAFYVGRAITAMLTKQTTDAMIHKPFVQRIYHQANHQADNIHQKSEAIPLF